MGLIHSVIVNHGIRDPKKAATAISDYVESTNDSRDWVAVFPYLFNNPLRHYPLGNDKDLDLKFGAFTVKTKPHAFESLEKYFKLSSNSRASREVIISTRRTKERINK